MGRTATPDHSSYFTDEIDCYENLTQNQETEIEQLRAELAQLKQDYNGALCLKDHTVDPNISLGFARVLKKYDGPMADLSSLKRYYNPNSLHFHGRAADIRLNENGVAFLDWIEKTEEGQAWKKDHNIRVLVEFTDKGRQYRRYKKKYGKVVIVNKKATAPHIHIEMRNS